MRLSIVLALSVGLSVPGTAAELPIDEVGTRAAAGEPAAMVELGLAYREAGLPTVAADWFCAAAESGHPDADFWCGRSLIRGFGRSIDAKRGRIHLERAAANGSAAAALLLGARTIGGESERWFEIAGRSGAPEGDFRLGLLLDRQGKRAAAVEAYARAAEQGFGPALNAIGIGLLNTAGNDPAMRLRAQDAFVRGAELGDQSAQLNAALLLTTVDPTTALKYLSLAMAGKNPQIRLMAAQTRANISQILGSSETERVETLVAPEIEPIAKAFRLHKDE